MGYAEEQFDKYLRQNLTLLDDIKVDELLNYLSCCLSKSTVEKLNAYTRNQGNRKTVMDLYLTLSGSDNWAKHFIAALRHCEHNELADTLEGVYSSFQLPANRSSPQSPRPSWNPYEQQSPQGNPQGYSSLPGYMSPTSPPAPLPKPSQRLNQIQPEQEMIQSSPSQQNHEFRSLPPCIQDPPAPPRTPRSPNVSPATHSDRRVLEEVSFINPVPETTPYQPLEVDVEDKSSISRNPHIGSDPLPNGSLSPSLKEPLPAVSIRPTSQDVSLAMGKSSTSKNSRVGADPLYSGSLSPSLKEPLPAVSIKPTSEDVSPAKVPESRSTPTYSPTTSRGGGSDNLRSQPLRNKEPETETTPTYGPSTSSEGAADNRRSQPVPDKEPETQTTPTNSPSTSSEGAADRRSRPVPDKVPETQTTPTNSPSTSSEGAADNRRGHPVPDKPANRPEPPVSASDSRSVTDKVVTEGRHNGQPAYQAVDNVADRRSTSVRPVIKETTEEEPNRGWPSSQRVPPGSSCRPFDNINDDTEDYLSKPEVLRSTVEEESSVMSHAPRFEISYSDSGESGNTSSSPPISQDPVPRASSPNNRSMERTDLRGPEENDFTFDSKSSPGRSNQLGRSLSKKPVENSYEMRDVSQLVLQYSERPEVQLLGGNDNTLRHRPGNTPNTIESSHQDTAQGPSHKAEGRDYERTVLISVTVASLCLSLYLLWKSRGN